MKIKIETIEELVTLIQVIAWAFVVFIVMTVFGGTVFSMLYSVIFVSQPIKTMAPIDMAFTKMLNDIVLLLTGSITTLVGMFAINKSAKALAEKIAPAVLTTPPTAPSSTPAPQSVTPNWNFMGYQNPDLDESWTPGPPPTTPPEHLEPDDVRQEIAAARAGER